MDFYFLFQKTIKKLQFKLKEKKTILEDSAVKLFKDC